MYMTLYYVGKIVQIRWNGPAKHVDMSTWLDMLKVHPDFQAIRCTTDNEDNLPIDAEFYLISLDDLYHLAWWPFNAIPICNFKKDDGFTKVKKWFDKPSHVPDRKFIFLVDSTLHWSTLAVHERIEWEIGLMTGITNRCSWFCKDRVESILKIFGVTLSPSLVKAPCRHLPSNVPIKPSTPLPMPTSRTCTTAPATKTVKELTNTI